MANRPKIALVTGASGGIGKAIATTLAEDGYHVIAAARSMKVLEAMAGSNIEPHYLDVTEPESITKLYQDISEKHHRLDVLVNNAGYGVSGPIEAVPLEEAKKQFEVNVFGAMEVTRAALPMMRAQKSGRIIQLASIVSHISYPVMGWYSASKHAIQALMDALRLEVEEFGIHVSMIKPGPIETGFEETTLKQLDELVIPEAYLPLVENYKELMHENYKDCPGPGVVVEAVKKALRDDDPKSSYVDTMQSKMTIATRTLLGERLFDKLLRSKLQ